MKRTKKKLVQEQTDQRQRVVRFDTGHRQNFSYHSNSVRDKESDQNLNGRLRSKQSGKKVANKKHGKIFWFGLLALLVFIGQFFMLGTNARVVVLDSNGAVQEKDVKRYEATIAESVRSSLLNRNKLTFDARGIAKNLEKSHPELQSADVTVSTTSNRPIAYVTQYSAKFLLRQGSMRYGLTSNGFVVDMPKISEALPVIHDETGEEIGIGKQLLPRNHVQFIETVVYQLDQNDVSVASILLPAQKAYEVNIRLKSKPYVLRFNLAEDPLQQSGAAVAAMKSITAVTPQYIDVRVPGRVYYK